MPSTLNTLFFLISITFLFFHHHCYSIDEQGQALLTWKNSLNATEPALKSWDSSDTTPCNWFGVHCNSNGDVVEISLKSMELQGSLPSNFQSLKSLKTLILSSNNLSGVIPKEFGDYNELNFIDLSGNFLTGEIPMEICKLKKLKTLAMYSNYLGGKIPSMMGNLSGLVYLTLYDNQLNGEIPKSIGELKMLQVFRVGGNKDLNGELPLEIGNCTSLLMLGLAETSITGNLPSSIGMLKRVQTVAIYTSLLSGSIPEEISNCSELQNLYLYQNSISGSIPRGIGQLNKLQSLLLWQNSLVGTIPDELGTCSELTVVDLSENLLTGSIPRSIGKLLKLQELQLSVNQLSGTIPSEILNCSELINLEIDNNAFSGEVPVDIGKLNSLTIFFAWQNKLTGNVPDSLSQCKDLQAIDLSYNSLSGSIPKDIFGLKNLTKLLLLANDLSGFIPPEIGNCTNLYRLRLNGNRLAGTIPSEIGNLKGLNFVDLSENRFVGGIPLSISGCRNLEFLDLHSNGLAGSLPDTLPTSLQYVDISDNSLTGQLSHSIGSLSELTKLNLGKNRLSGQIPTEISSCSKLQLVNLGDNGFFGEIPKELGQIPALEISLNLSWNRFSGKIPSEFSGLTKLAILDLSHNKFSGKLDVLTSLQNLVSLNVSFNDFSGELPNSSFFRKLPLSDLESNKGLYISNGVVSSGLEHSRHVGPAVKLVMSILISASVILVLLAIYALIRARFLNNGLMEDYTWEVTLYQKLDFSIDDIVHNLTSSNVIGTGSSGVVYRVTIPQNDAENLSQAYVHDKDKSIDCQTVLDKTDYCNEQNVSCSHTGLENLECSVEEANVQVSCVSTEQQIVETSLLGEGFMEDKCKLIANVLGTMDDRSVRNFDHADNETVAVSGMSVPDLQSEYKFESCIDKRFDEEVADNENNVVLPGCWISNKENVSDGPQAFVYCKTSESSVITLDCSSQQTHQTLCLPDIENGKAQVHAEPLLRATELVPEVTVLKKTEDKELDSEGVLTMSVEMVGVDPVIGLEEMRSHSIHITSTISDLGDDVENARTIKDVLHPSLGSVDDSLNFYSDSDPKRSVPPSATSEDEQFLFSDLDEFKLHEPDCVNKDLHSSICTETEEVNGLCNVNNEPCFNPHNFVQESPSTDLDFSVEKAGIVSNPISISRNHKVAGEKNGWQIESLPTTWPVVAKFDVNNNLPLSHSLDSSCETLKWISIKEDDERPLAHGKSSCEESETSRKLENTLYNPCIGDPSEAVVSCSRSWRLWPFSMKRSISRKDVLLAPADNRGLDAKNAVDGAVASDDDKNVLKPKQVKKMIRAITPTSEQLASLNLKDGINHITFTFSTSMLGKQQVDARIYLWKWNTRIVISDVDGTITRSDVLGQFMPMVGIDWLQTGVAHLFSAIKENGYELLFLSARAISQAYITRQFLVNLKQDGKGLPDGPIVISPDGLFPSLYREVIRRAPHEFKIACLEAIKALFPLDCNPFYAGFGNRDTDEMSYLKVGIPKGKIFTINPKGEVVTNHHVATKSYSSLHDLVHRMFPPMASEQEEFNSWNFWKLPPPLINI